MPMFSRRCVLRWAAFHAGVCGTFGCGTILHPERRGQAAGPLDWKIVALDGIGLLLFFIPGVIAFAVDFSNGTIYLPEGSYGRDDQPARKSLITHRIPCDSLTAAELESIVAQQTGQTIHLKSGAYQTEELAHIDEFWPTAERLSGT